MNQKELKSYIQGPIATVPTPFDKNFEVDYGRMHQLSEWWVDNGLVKGKAVIKVAAAMGEGPMLSDNEWPALLRTTVQATKGKASVVCGLHYKDTKRTIEDAKIAQDMGANGLQVCPPIFNSPSQKDILNYFSDLSNAIDIGIMVYHTHWLRGGRIEVDTILNMSEIENVVSIKWSNPADVAFDEMSKFSDRFNVINNGGDPVTSHELGGRGYINLTAHSYPKHDLTIWDLMENKKYDEARELYTTVDEPLRKINEKINERSGGQGRIVKGMMALMGLPCGSSRPPSEPMDVNELNGLREHLVNFGWPVQLTAKQAFEETT